MGADKAFNEGSQHASTKVLSKVFDKVYPARDLPSSATVAESARTLEGMQDINGGEPKTTNHPPLARDPQGNLVELPKATCAWRIGRETTGRPRIILSPDNQPMRFPLHLTCEQLVEMCGPDIYHVYAVDEFGNILGR